MNAGDRVRMRPMWKYDEATGTIQKVRKDGYVVVKWDDINGQWHYTEDQSKKLEIINEDR